jgi:hypothetical protein
MYNGLDIQQSCWFVKVSIQTWQSRWFVKVSIQTWLAIMMEPYFQDWLDIPTTPMPTPLSPNEAFIKRLYSTEGDPSAAIQTQLEKQTGIKYRKAMGQLIWPMTTCRPDLAQAVVKLAQHSAMPPPKYTTTASSLFSATWLQL